MSYYANQAAAALTRLQELNPLQDFDPDPDGMKPTVIQQSVFTADSMFGWSENVAIQWFNERANSSISVNMWEAHGTDPLIEEAVKELTAIDGAIPRAIQGLDGRTFFVGRSWLLGIDRSSRRASGREARLAYIPWAGTGVSHSAICQRVYKPAEGHCFVRWFYRDENGLQAQMMPLDGADPQPAFYPWMDMDQVFAEYAKSEANVLLLIGPPGTGKTTFLRGLLRQMKLEAWLTYDRHVQEDEQLYIQFASIGQNGPPIGISNSEGRVLVLEDADTMLQSREDGNALMSRLLNLSNGLISLPKRKLVFSTNLPSVASVDPAILRPGRCFAVIKFRPLTALEAARARRSVGLPPAVLAGEYTLAEALNGRKNGSGDAVRQVGFA